MNEMSFTGACRHYFGLRDGQSLSDFMLKVKRLTDADKLEIRAGLEALGYKIKS